eukprot:snap_masked-scaffold_81-processed-gene-0.38-mRNA-1 protein AED:1.00 eAED:1.00 QI:0/0/0/0/1/1/2/0/85
MLYLDASKSVFVVKALGKNNKYAQELKKEELKTLTLSGVRDSGIAAEYFELQQDFPRILFVKKLVKMIHLAQLIEDILVEFVDEP